MSCLRLRPFLSVILPTCAAVLAVTTAAQDVPGTRQDENVGREQMWPAPTAEDWRKPVLIQWQRTWEDAVAVSQETKKPILVCVNMDGEIASEHYAGVRYRQPEVAKLYEPYVTVIASVYRHNPRDFDEHGHRIECPRFGGVTCGEHIEIEPILFEKFMDGRRIAPRHIMVELDGEETYDVFYAFDTYSVFESIRDGIAERAETPPAVVRGDRTLVERVASRDSVDRVAVESAYQQGDKDLKRSLLEAAVEQSAAAPTGLLRLAVFGFDEELQKLARRALAQIDSQSAVDLVNEALRVPLEPAEREALVAALEKLGDASPRARTLSVVHRGLGSRSRAVDVEGWSTALRGGASYTAATDWAEIESRVETRTRQAEARPDDAATKLELAEASLALAVDPKTSQILSADRRTASTYARLMFEDAYRTALEAETLGASGWKLDATIALSAYYLGRVDEAYSRAEAAMEHVPSGAQEWSAISTIALFAQARQKAITEAVVAKQDWPGQWLTDMNAAYSVLARHPLGTDRHVASHYDFLDYLGAAGPAARVLDQGLSRFPESWVLHDRLRNRILREKGVAGLEDAYAEMLAEDSAPPNLRWFAGYASIVAAEFHRRRGRDAQALESYDRAIDHYERSIEARPQTRATADHYVAVAMGGRARLAYESGEDERALAEVLASFAREPDAAASLDGLNISTVDTAKMLLARLQAQERTDLVAKLETALGELDPKMLELPAYERDPQGGPGRGNRGNRGRRGRRGR